MTWEANWTDTGCELSPSCLNCHLPRCQYDVYDAKPVREPKRYEDLVPLIEAGIENREIARQAGVGLRTVTRAKAALRRSKVLEAAS